MREFCDTLSHCQLHDLGYIGARFTWCNMRQGGDFVKERLDRALATNEWNEDYPVRVVEVLANRSSDHNPLFIKFSKPLKRNRHWHRKFRFEAAWNGMEKPTTIIQQVWREANEGINAWQRVGRSCYEAKMNC